MTKGEMLRRSKARDVAVVALQMHAYVATYQMPNDDPERLRARVRVRYPVLADRAIGLGELPGLRMQRAFARHEGQPLRVAEQALVWCHWLWFFVPHGTVAYLLARRGDQLASGATQIYAVFDLGLIGYWALPTAPPGVVKAIDTASSASCSGTELLAEPPLNTSGPNQSSNRSST